MSERSKTNLLKYGISAAVCAAMVWFYISVRDFSAQALVDKYRILCDAFTVPGLLAILAGVLLAVTNQGALDGIGYACSTAFKALIPGGRLKMEKYYDYVQRKNEKRVKGYGFLFIVGGACMLIAVVFMILFYHLY